jgi:hypothetical protein
MNLTIGADPELAVIDELTGKPVPAWLITDAKKDGEHQKITEHVDIHSDGVALEFNFTPSSPHNFVDHSLHAYQNVVSFLHHFSQTKGGVNYVPSRVPEITGYDKETLMHPIAVMTGCDPDFDAYRENPDIPRDIKQAAHNNKYKFFGGHIHVGYDKEKCPPWAVARLMDLMVYLPLMMSDMQPLRKEWHGQPGIFRPKIYGMEYRTPSNFWVGAKVESRHIRDNIWALFTLVEEDTQKLFKAFHNIEWLKVKKAIQDRDIKQGRRLWEMGYKALSTDRCNFVWPEL